MGTIGYSSGFVEHRTFSIKAPGNTREFRVSVCRAPAQAFASPCPLSPVPWTYEPRLQARRQYATIKRRQALKRQKAKGGSNAEREHHASRPGL
jgi:hypothetical protein